MVAFPCMPAKAATQVVAPTLVISELQTTGQDAQEGDDGTKEFVEVYNPSDVALNGAADWRLEYLSASSDGNGAPTRVLGTIDVVVGARSYLLFSYEGYIAGADKYFGSGSAGWIAKSGGHIRIVNGAGQTIDAVEWGSAVPLKSGPGSGSNNWWHAPSIPAGTSIGRILSGEPAYTDGLTFASPGEPTPYGGNRPLPTEPGEDPGEEPELPPPDNPLPDPAEPPDTGDTRPCEGIILTELLPNPSGADSGREFIEVYNANNVPTTLAGCSLRMGAGTSGGFSLPDELLMPGAYRAFYDGESGITLPNATPQAVWLIGSDQPLSVLYQSAMDDDQTWSLFEEGWEATDQPTPEAPNARSRVAVVPSVETPTIKTAPAAVVCPAGKERNPATNRCRSIATATSLASCKPGQERSPETNRCRTAVLGASLSKPCPVGQERNESTNRCRKKTDGAASIAQIQDVKSASPATNFRWWIAGLLAAGALSYALYEWRRDIGNALHSLKAKYASKK